EEGEGEEGEGVVRGGEGGEKEEEDKGEGSSDGQRCDPLPLRPHRCRPRVQGVEGRFHLPIRDEFSATFWSHSLLKTASSSSSSSPPNPHEEADDGVGKRSMEQMVTTCDLEGNDSKEEEGGSLARRDEMVGVKAEGVAPLMVGVESGALSIPRRRCSMDLSVKRPGIYGSVLLPHHWQCYLPTPSS
ncbi:hypothetical protein B296_00045113, partial [Ensete ventricosum]